jgi:hypothetical protein
MYGCHQPFNKEQLFQLLPSSKTDIKFTNNGGGVEVLDVNNYGLPDLNGRYVQILLN